MPHQEQKNEALIGGSELNAGLGNLPTMADAVQAGDSVLLNEQAALLRECSFAIDELLRQKPLMAGLLCGSTTLGNLRVDLHKYRPQGVFGRSSLKEAMHDAGFSTRHINGEFIESPNVK